MLRWLLCAQQAGTELYRIAGFSILKEQRDLMDSREFRSESAYDASFWRHCVLGMRVNCVILVVPGSMSFTSLLFLANGETETREKEVIHPVSHTKIYSFIF